MKFFYKEKTFVLFLEEILVEHKMTSAQSASKERRGPQARGIERRNQLLEAADTLLLQKSIDDISLADVAQQAGFPVASAYSLFPNINAVMAQLMIRHTEALVDGIESAIDPEAVDAWPQVIEQFIDGMVRYYRSSRPAQQLRLSGHALPEVRYAEDRQTGQIIAGRLRQLIERAFELPRLEQGDRVFVIMLDIADAVLVSEFIRTGSLPQGIGQEAKRASLAYLKLYIPEFLPRNISKPPSEGPV